MLATRRSLHQLLASVVAAALAGFALRRVVILIGALLPRKTLPITKGALPPLAVVVAARNESSSLDPLLTALQALNYPPGRLSIVLVNDGSTDDTGPRFEHWASERGDTRVLNLPGRVGKAQALNEGISAAGSAELIAVCDADQSPRADAFVRLASVFIDPTVGAAAGFLSPRHSPKSLIGRYAAVEAWVHQLVTSAGKDRLDLNPPMLGGGSVYRRAALDALGGFPSGLSGEDVTTSVALTEAGWRTRFIQDAVVDNPVVSEWGAYWNQHVRWARNVFDSVERHRTKSGAPLHRRLESWFLSAGYADRIVLLAGPLLVTRRWLRIALPAAYLAVAAAEVAAALAKAGVAPRSRAYAVAAAVIFPVDIAATVVATAAHVRGAPRDWRSPRAGTSVYAGP